MVSAFFLKNTPDKCHKNIFVAKKKRHVQIITKHESRTGNVGGGRAGPRCHEVHRRCLYKQFQGAERLSGWVSWWAGGGASASVVGGPEVDG